MEDDEIHDASHGVVDAESTWELTVRKWHMFWIALRHAQKLPLMFRKIPFLTRRAGETWWMKFLGHLGAGVHTTRRSSLLSSFVLARLGSQIRERRRPRGEVEAASKQTSTVPSTSSRMLSIKGKFLGPTWRRALLTSGIMFVVSNSSMGPV